MKSWNKKSWLTQATILGLASLLAGCASTPEQDTDETTIPLEEVRGPAHATVERVTAGGRVDQITRERERGQIVYDVEATVDGRHLEFLIADTDGAVLGTEVPIEFDALPAAVQAAAERHFGYTSGLAAMKGLEFGETTFEVEGLKNGKEVEVTYNPEGKRVE